MRACPLPWPRKMLTAILAAIAVVVAAVVAAIIFIHVIMRYGL